MSNPQKENGYTGIANEILEYIMKQNLNGTQFRIVLAVWRLTYGYQRTVNEMSINFLVTLIEANRRQVVRELNTLIARNIITIVETGKRKTRKISFNKRYDEWTSCIPKVAEKVKKDATPAKVKKKTSPKNSRTYEEANTYYKMAKYFYQRVLATAEAEGLKHLINKADLQKWSDEMRKLVEIDKVADMSNKEDRKMVSEVMDWVTSDSFWKVNVLSAKKFRDKFPELALKMKASQNLSETAKLSKADPRDKEIKLQQWIQEGNDPDEFDWGKHS